MSIYDGYRTDICLIYFLRRSVGAAGVSFLEWVEMGLFASYISPPGNLELGCTAGVSFQERLRMGLYDARRAIGEGDRVTTLLGNATVSQIKHCNILNRMRVVVYLETPRENGVRLVAFDVWQVKRLVNAEQVSLW